jgi:hypothetical protein
MESDTTADEEAQERAPADAERTARVLDMEYPCNIVVARFIIWNTNSPLERGFQTLGIMMVLM